MKRTILAMAIGLSLSAGLSTVLAQTEEAKPTPKPPYIIPVPDYGHWVVTFKYAVLGPDGNPTSSGNPAAAGAEPGSAATSTADPVSPVSIDTIKTGDLRGIMLTFPDGTSREITCQGAWVLTSTDKGPQLGTVNPSSKPYRFYTAGFIMLDGVKINSSTFRETSKHNGILAFHYKSGNTDVWIDPASQRPLAVKQPDVEATYQFLPPPPRPFSIPTDQASLMKKEEQADQNTRAMR